MERTIISDGKHLNIVAVKKNGAVKRFEISPEAGYQMIIDDSAYGMLICPAKKGIESIIDKITVKESDQS